MRTTRVALPVTVAAVVALAALPPYGRAEEGEATFGGQWWTQTQPEAKFREFRDVPRGGFLESFVLAEWNGRNMWRLAGSNAIRKDQFTRLTWANGIRWRADASYTRIPHLFSETAKSPFVEVSPGVFLLPDSLQIHNQRNPDNDRSPGVPPDTLPYTQTMTDLLNSAPRIGLGFNTDYGKARLRGRPAQGWQFEVSGVQRQRSGRKAWGAPFGFNSELELWEPINQRMIDTDARASYHRERVTLQASGGFSLFDNRVTALRWDNPKRLTDTTYAGAYVAGDGPAAGQSALYPDNRTYRGSVALSVRMPRRSMLVATVGASQVRQDETDWLPLTINTALRPDTIPLPASNTDGRADILTEDIQITTRAVSKLSGTVRYYGYKYDNKTPERTFTKYARLDAVLEPENQPSVTSEPFGNEQKTIGVDLDFDPMSRLSVGGTYEYRIRDHIHREVAKDNENVFGVRASARPTGELSIDARYRRGDRKLDSFEIEDYQRFPGDTTLVEQPGLRRYDVADRKQDDVGAGASWSAGERLDLSALYGYLRNDYDHSIYGLQKEEQHSVTTQAAVHPHERFDLRGGYGYIQTRSRQKSNESGAIVTTDVATDWMADIKDLNSFVFAGADWRAVPDKLSLSADYEYSRDFAGYRLSNTAKTARDVPSTKYRRHYATVQARYRLLPRTELTGRYGWEEFDVLDFAAKDVPLLSAGSNRALTSIYLGDFYRDYRAHRIALLVRQSF